MLTFFRIQSTMAQNDGLILGNAKLRPEIFGLQVFWYDNRIEDNFQLIVVDRWVGTQELVHRQLRVEHDAVELFVEPAIHQRCLAFARQVTTHHHLNILSACYLTGIGSRKRLLEVVGMNGTRWLMLDDISQRPRTTQVEHPS